MVNLVEDEIKGYASQPVGCLLSLDNIVTMICGDKVKGILWIPNQAAVE